MLRHVAMFKWKEGITDEQKIAARDSLANLKGTVPSVVEYTVGFDIERNPNNWDMVLVADFEGVAGLETVLRRSDHERCVRPCSLGHPEGDHRSGPVRDLTA